MTKVQIELAAMLRADTVWSLLERRVAATPDATLLIDAASGQRLSFAQVLEHALDCAGSLQAQGIAPGSVVAWQLPTRISTVLITLALARLGAVQAPVIHLYRERELREVLVQSRPDFILTPPEEDGQDYPARVAASIDGATRPPRALIVERQWPASQHALPPAPESGDVVRWHYYTSGTTSRPKGAKHTDQSLMAAGRGLGGILGMGENEVGTVGFPFAHVGGIAYISAALAGGMSVVLFERYVPSEVAAAFREYGVTFAGGSTAHYQALLAEQRRQPDVRLAPSLKVLSAGGAAKPAALYHQVRDELGCKAVHAYGLTECPICFSNSPGDTDEQLAHSDGVPLNGMEAKILRADGSLCAAGESGEILLRGPNLCRGYLDDQQTRDAFEADGFFRTGDLGLMRSDGRLTVTGRIKDIIIRKGENISALEIEELLSEHPKVREVAVIGLPDERRGERVCAVVVPRDGAQPLEFAEMQAFLLQRRLMRQKIPEQLENMASLPRNEGLQKVVKVRLREQLMAR